MIFRDVQLLVGLLLELSGDRKFYWQGLTMALDINVLKLNICLKFLYYFPGESRNTQQFWGFNLSYKC